MQKNMNFLHYSKESNYKSYATTSCEKKEKQKNCMQKKQKQKNAKKG